MSHMHPTPPVPIPDLAVWRHIATGNLDLRHLPAPAARLVRAQAWAALRADRAQRIGQNLDAIAHGAGRATVAHLPTRRAPYRVTLTQPTTPGDAA